jgi:hypothetical protein
MLLFFLFSETGYNTGHLGLVYGVPSLSSPILMALLILRPLNVQIKQFLTKYRRVSGIP